jgi:hypothetical protein
MWICLDFDRRERINTGDVYRRGYFTITGCIEELTAGHASTLTPDILFKEGKFRALRPLNN